MSRFAKKTPKGESADATPYTVYHPHSRPASARIWDQPYLQFVSIDPARKNYALRIERRYKNGRIEPLVFTKISINTSREENGVTICDMYQQLTTFLETYQRFYDECHVVLVERQLQENYKATRLAQHTISWFSIYLKDKPLLPSIVEMQSSMKTRLLNAPKGLSKTQVKTWSVYFGRELAMMRGDSLSIRTLDTFATKQDDLTDTMCMIEAICRQWSLPLTPGLDQIMAKFGRYQDPFAGYIPSATMSVMLPPPERPEPPPRLILNIC